MTVIAAWCLMAVSMLFSNPPGAAPDEGAHYLRAMGVGRGQVVLDRPPSPPPGPQELARRINWMWMQSGSVRLPERLGVEPFECWAHPRYLGTCEEQTAPQSDRTASFSTYVGTYPPFPYLLPGLLMRAASDSETALMLGRVASMVACLALLAGAVLALAERDGRPWLAGIVCTVTPMVVIAAASLTGSGIEMAAAICLFACLLRLARSPGARADAPQPPAPGWVWGLGAAGGFILAVTRDLGPAWVALQLGLVGILVGRRRLRTIWSAAGSSRWVFAATLLAGLAVGLAWRVSQGVPPDLSRLQPPALDLGFLLGLGRQAVGIFGPLDALMPEFAYLLWGLVVATLLIAAFIRGTRRQRLVLGISILTVFLVVYGMEAVQNIYDFGTQARQLMPAVVCVPLLAGEIVAGARVPRWRPERFLAPALVTAAGFVHLVAWHTLGRRYAVGLDGPIFFFSSPAVWSPPGGWITWGVVMFGGVLALTLPFLATLREESSH